MRIAAPALLLVLLVAPRAGAQTPRPEPVEADASIGPARVELGDRVKDLALLHELGIDVDAVFDTWARVYVNAEEIKKLEHLGLQLEPLPDEGKIGLARLAEEEAAAEGLVRGVPAQYHTHDTLTTELESIAMAHADIVELTSIGLSEQGRELWMVKITDNPTIEEDEPAIAYISSMHGDEVVGKELCVNLINHLTDNYGIDPRVTDLVDGAELWIMPSMNPDGTALGRRQNANFIDLNRDFPDQFIDPVNDGVGRAAETAALIAWGMEHRTALSSNFHGGALVANYPYDSNPQSLSIYSPSPDESLFVSLSRTFADNNPDMAVSNSSSAWDNGITNGANWYAINGGMQDWTYVWRGGLEVLVEVSSVKWPPANQLPSFWSANFESLMSYLERGREGVRGIVTDSSTGLPLSAEIRVNDYPFLTYTDPDVGDYHRVLLPGAYTLEIASTGYSTRTIGVTVAGGLAVRHDVALDPLDVDLQHDAHRLLETLDPGGTADLAVTLRNFGLSASGISGQLEPIGWFGRVTGPPASYPDLAPDQAGESSAPYHAIAADPATPVGHKLGFVVDWSSDQASDVSEPFFVALGAPQCESVAATDLPKGIFDHATTTSSLSIAGGLELESVAVTVDILHSYRGDIWVELISPSGTPVLLHGRTGGSANNIVGTYADKADPNDPTPLVPYERLSRLSGESASGGWTLNVRDGAGGDTGTLQGFTLEVCGRPLEVTTPELRLRSLDRDPSGVKLRWWPYPGLTSYRVYRSTDPASAGAFLDVTSEDDDSADTRFDDTSTDPLVFYLVTGIGPQGEGPKGHFGQ